MRNTVIALMLTGSLSACAEGEAAWSAANTAGAAANKATAANAKATIDNLATAQVNQLCLTPYVELVVNGTGNPSFPAAVIKLCGQPSGLLLYEPTK